MGGLIIHCPKKSPAGARKKHSIKYIFSISSATHFPLAERWIFPKQFRPWRFFSYKKASALSRGYIRGIKGGYLNINTPDMITRRRREKNSVFFSNLFFFKLCFFLNFAFFFYGGWWWLASLQPLQILIHSTRALIQDRKLV